jgi:hypothetical protein
MALLDRLTHALMELLWAIVAIVMAALAWIETVLGIPMRAAGLPPDLQLVIGVLVAIVVVVAAVRLFGGVLRLALVVLLVVLVLHAVGNRAFMPPHGPGKPPIAHE